jgi:hypothetical protein
VSRLASIGARSVHQPLTLAIYDQLEQSTDWDYVAGADLASLTAGNTLNVTSRHHKVTLVGGTIDNIADAAGPAAGQLLELYFTGATTIRNNGGGTGNIRTISGADMAIAVGDVVELVYDGTNWRECARSQLQFPNAGTITWGTDTNLYRVNAAQLQTDGVLVAAGGFIADVVGANNMFRNFLLSTDAQPAFRILGNGGIGWGPGAAGAIDTFLSRNSVPRRPDRQHGRRHRHVDLERRVHRRPHSGAACLGHERLQDIARVLLGRSQLATAVPRIEGAERWVPRQSRSPRMERSRSCRSPSSRPEI